MILTRKNLLGPLLVSLALASVLPSRSTAQPQKNILVVSVATVGTNDAAEAGNQVFQQLSQFSGDFLVDFARTTQELSQKMTPSALEGYDVVVFQNTMGDLPLPDTNGFFNWIASGKAFLAIHTGAAAYPTSGSGTFPNYPPYATVLGASMPGHAGQRTVTVVTRDTIHPSTRHLSPSLKVYDEIYLHANVQWGVVHELFGMATNPQTGVAQDYPLAWCRFYGSGRVLCSSLGHRVQTWQQAWFQQHILGAIRWLLKLDRALVPTLVPDQPPFTGSAFGFSYAAAAVETYTVQTSDDLFNWNPVFTNSAPSNTTFRIQYPGGDRHFYRVLCR